MISDSTGLLVHGGFEWEGFPMGAVDWHFERERDRCSRANLLADVELGSLGIRRLL